MYNIPISIHLFYISCNENLKENMCIYLAENNEVCMFDGVSDIIIVLILLLCQWNLLN